MRYKVIFFICVNIFVGFVQVGAQNLELLSSGGGNVSTNIFTGSYSIGEPMINTFITQNFRLTQGFQQTNEFTTSATNPRVDVIFDVYPNPFYNEIFVKPSNGEVAAFIRIENLQGKIQYFQKLDQLNANGRYRIDTTSISSGVSILQIYDERKRLIHSFTLVKI